ncbi:hypothetical protein JHK87_044904 [Glycine soja]|nr:hypothetical protein JHK87_044904 [Glycine soja]
MEASRFEHDSWTLRDMDAFYGAVEAISNLTLNGKPMAVRSMSMLSSSNYEPGSSCLNQWDPGRSFMAALVLHIVGKPIDNSAGIYDKQYEQSEEFQQELKVKVHELLVEQE